MKIKEIWSKMDERLNQRLSFSSSFYFLVGFDLTNCQLKQENKKIVDCPSYVIFPDCLAKLEGDSWTAFTTFYSHCENICFYYNSPIWYEDSEKLINNGLQIYHWMHRKRWYFLFKEIRTWTLYGCFNLILF